MHSMSELVAEIKKYFFSAKNVAPVEKTTTATVQHLTGSQFYLNGVLYEAISGIAIGDTIVLPGNTGANVKVADDITTQIANKGQIDNTPTSGSNNAVSSGGVYSALLNKEFSTKYKRAFLIALSPASGVEP